MSEVSAGKNTRVPAFRRLVSPQIDMLLRVAFTLTGNWRDAEDVVQDTLVRAWRAIDRFDGAYPRAWLLTILRHTYANSTRGHRPDLLEDLEGRPPAFGTPVAADPLQRHIDRELSAPLQRAISGLDPRYRTVLLLVDVDQLQYAEAAELLGIPVGTVVSRLSRAREKVRRALRRDAEGAAR